MVSFMHWVSAAKWIGTVTCVAGAMVIALNFGFIIYGFYFYLVSSTLWSVVGWMQREPSLFVLQGAFTAINILGIYR
jgi:hypothetical protein